MLNINENSKIKCSCGCGFAPAEPALSVLKKIAADFKTETGKTLLVTSGARCAAYNKKAGGVQKSAHTKGLAFDIVSETSFERYFLIKLLLDNGVKRVGINFNKNFVHFDIDETLPMPVLFKY